MSSIPDGYHDIAPGKIAVVVTCLEMLSPPVDAGGGDGDAFSIRRVPGPAADWYRDLYRRVGEDWLWFSRLQMPDDALLGIIRDPAVEVYALRDRDRDEGLLELDFRVPGECELAFFGVTAALIGRGAGRALMRHAIAQAWMRPISRFWVHTCTGDHPSALRFYIRSGFVPFKRQIEVADDPRLTSALPKTAAPHVPILGG